MAKSIDIAALSEDSPPMESIPLEAYEGELAVRNGHARGSVSPQKLPAQEPPLFDAARAPIGMQTFTEVQLPPEFIVDGLIPSNIGARVGAGGTAKSTLALWEAVHLIMGWPLYGYEVLRPGKVLIVSGEDTVQRIRFRLRMLCEQIADLSDAAKRHIASSLLVEDLSGKGTRLVAVDGDGNLTQTGIADVLIDAYTGEDLALVHIDPLVYFGPGERFVNDGEAAMAQVAHRICTGLRCAVMYTHHTGKANAREGRTDQYSGRNGSALPDGMRFVQVLSRLEKPDEYPQAPFAPEDYRAGRALALHVPKITDAPPIEAPIFIRRQGWRIEWVKPIHMTEEEHRREQLRKLTSFVEAQAAGGIRHTSNSLEGHLETIGLGRNELRATLHAALELGVLIECPLPDTERRGRRQSYLAMGRSA